jgi:hypothetical protein
MRWRRAARCGAPHRWGRARRGVVACATLVAVLVVAAPAHGAPRARVRAARPSAFAWLVPAAAPADWPALVAPAAPATLAYPPSFRPVGGDPGSVSAAIAAPPSPYLAYLNATPRQGREQPHGYAAFRIALLGEDHDEAVHLEAAREGIRLRGGVGSCVMDRYTTRVGHHQYREIACLVVGPHGRGAVIVAAAMTSTWARYERQLETAVAAFTVG